MIKYIKLESVEKYDNYSSRIVKVEPDIYINQYANKRIFFRNDCFEKTLQHLQLVVQPSMISPSIEFSEEALEEYSEIIAEPVSTLLEKNTSEYIYVSSEQSYYLSESLFKVIFEKDNIDILVD